MPSELLEVQTKKKEREHATRTKFDKIRVKLPDKVPTIINCLRLNETEGLHKRALRHLNSAHWTY